MYTAVFAMCTCSMLLLSTDRLGNTWVDVSRTLRQSVPAASAGKSYTDSHGRKIRFPLGELSFADEVGSFSPGSPAAANEKHRDPKMTLGAADKNQVLSLKRAQAVRDFPAAQGLQDRHYDIRGYGESRLVASNDTEEGRVKNRRVVIIVVSR